jgi:hypothetical protein
MAPFARVVPRFVTRALPALAASSSATRSVLTSPAMVSGRIADDDPVTVAGHWTAEVRRITLSSQRLVSGRRCHSSNVSSRDTAR